MSTHKEQRVILNVGGIKYETYRSTLTAYPSTMLGTMFQERNSSLLHPTDGVNEYFFDRNGHAFRFIIEFYRTGRILWEDPYTTVGGLINPTNVSRNELHEEIEYFRIPCDINVDYKRLKFKKRPAEVIDVFVNVLESFIDLALQEWHGDVKIYLYEDAISFKAFLDNEEVSNNHSFIDQNNFGVFKKMGYRVLKSFAKDIANYFKKLIPGLVWDCHHFDRQIPQVTLPHFSLKISFGDRYSKELLESTNLYSNLKIMDNENDEN
ncbi:9163_t:CDS:2 [Acaulospora colombiana]|uniref:9163_t:CDS:1 n=1 Tax=Acaulospora colombiana TaxID=27376 RepID=A0ACA9KFB9_9GLOM|nr:9163_t:CDS:2 [Acaulospora colombiana]